ncbi:MAG TPA: carbohydrate-binding domain-containing protein [Oscillospiraceae bacterium]|nr:carbohydrate-binding domain-containing protein [Oscillospiraceae bacterium]HRW57173.1 carbohydrate-binding domain-containing protein [Oscillospiraceae bacterium]
MKKKWMTFFLAALLCLSLAACQSTEEGTPAESASSESTGSFTDSDFEVGYSDYVTVTLADGTSSADGGGVEIDGDTVTITEEGTYLLTGALSDGQILVDAGDSAEIQLVLDNVSVACSGSAAIYVRKAGKVFLTMTEGSENSLTSSGEFAQTDDNNVDAAVFSKADLTMNGNGTLTVGCESGHGVVSKDTLKVAGGTYEITSASQGLSGKEGVEIADGVFVITSGKDGIHAENDEDATLGSIYIEGGTFVITAGGDGMDASGALTIPDGVFTLTTGGGSINASTDSNGQENAAWGQWGGGAANASDSTETETSAKGLKADVSILISGGDFAIDSSDDAVHTNGDLSIAGGTFAISSGDDGMHADAGLTVTDGTINITKSYEGLEGAALNISGGTISLVASDDGLNAAGGADSSSIGGRAGQNGFDTDTSASITISGGSLTIDASGDGIDSNGDLTVSGGTIYVSGPTNSGNGALDYAGTGTITGGVLIAAGSTGMAQNFGSDSTQGSILYNFSSEQSGGTSVTLTDGDGNVLASFTPEKQFQSVVVSAPGVVSGGTYTLTVGGESVTIEMTGTTYSNASSGMNGGAGVGPGGGTAPGNRTAPGGGTLDGTSSATTAA